jgi:hypothetical protein
MVDEKSKSSKQILSFNPPPLKAASVLQDRLIDRKTFF